MIAKHTKGAGGNKVRSGSQPKSELVADLFALCPKSYLIIKMSDIFPDYTVRSDIDILCKYKFAFAGSILKNISGFRMNPHKSGTHYQVDLYKNGKLYLKFDLMDSLEEYNLDADSVFKTKRAKLLRGQHFWVPSYTDELQIRLCEYKKNPKKTWHRDYIIKHGSPGLLFDLEPRNKVPV
jgi:hypothetical protein